MHWACCDGKTKLETRTMIKMKCNPCTFALIGAGALMLPAVTQAEEKPSTVMTALASTTISGYVDTSIQWNLGSGNRFAPAYGFGGSSKADGFNLNVVDLTLEKPVDPADAWGAGYKAELWMGPDANTYGTQSLFGNSKSTSDFGIQQAYVALHAPVGNGLDFKVGVFDTITGYEAARSVDNANFTRSWGWTIEPTTHTGVQGTYQFCQYFSATLGIADTFGPTINERAQGPNSSTLNGGTSVTRAESYKTYMGSVTFTAPTNCGFIGGSTLTACIINGFDSASPVIGGAADQTSYFVGATLNTPITGFKVGACYDYADVRHQPATVGFVPANGHLQVVGLYASYQVTEKMVVSGRGEWGESANATAFGATTIYEATATLQYDLWKNVLSRLELRWDHSGDASPAFGGEVTPSRDNSYILLASLAYKF